MITSRMSEEEEREYIRASVEALTRATGKPPIGWLGSESGEFTRTPQLLAQAGIRYVCDWVNDEQPYPLKIPQLPVETNAALRCDGPGLGDDSERGQRNRWKQSKCHSFS